MSCVVAVAGDGGAVAVDGVGVDVVMRSPWCLPMNWGDGGKEKKWKKRKKRDSNEQQMDE
jgi:hypothetical protein